MKNTKKSLQFIFNEVTVHSRFLAIVVFIGVLPAAAFYAGIRFERMMYEQQKVDEMSAQTLFDSNRSNCRIIDCSAGVISPKIEVVSPKGGDKVNATKPVQVIWKTSPTGSLSKVSVLLLDSIGQAAAKGVIVPDTGSTTIPVPAKIAKSTYSVLVQGVVVSGSTREAPFAYSGEFSF